MPPGFLPTHLRSLRLQNFTAFADATFEFVPGVNVLVGENGSGKTHVLKAMYGRTRLTASPEEGGHTTMTAFFAGGSQNTLIRFDHDEALIELPPMLGTIDRLGAMWSGVQPEGPQAVFLPAVDMTGHSKGFLAAQQIVQIDFDRTYTDVVAKLEASAPYALENLAAEQMQALQDRIGGTVEYDAGDRRFYVATPEGRIAMPLVAEGLRKFATVHTIWKNGWLRTGTCLFWDEPEANLNPSLMDEAVAAILALARGGVQVFLATHSYVILKELELQATEDDAVRFFALEKTDAGTVVHPADRYLDLKPNLIEEQYVSLFERTLEKRMREQAGSA